MRMRWTQRLGAYALAALSLSVPTGCKQQLYMEPCDHQAAVRIGMPKNLENDPYASVTPATIIAPEGSKSPTNINDLDRPLRYMSLQEAISIALEQGNIGSTSPLFPGQGIDALVSSTGRGIAGDDAVRVLALDPAITGADIERALSKFDVRWITSMTWNKQDQAIINLLQNFNNGDTANFNSAIVKPLPTGGVAGITFSTDYQQLSAPPEGFQVLNPSYRPRIQAIFEQPLLQGFGTDINQLSSAHPGSNLVPGLRPSGGTQVEGILVTRLRFDQSRADFERNVNYMMLNVETAYWNLYAAYGTLYARNKGLEIAQRVYIAQKDTCDAGKDPQFFLGQASAQLQLTRSQRLSALANVLENERQLRNLLGLPGDDGTRIVPSDTPTEAQFQPDWFSALQEAMQLRPELTLARLELKARQYDLILQKNSLRPDLRFQASYDINGLGQRLDGNPAENALGNLISNQFNSWSLGFRLDVPLGQRDAHAAVRISRLNLARSYAVLKDQERKAEIFLLRSWRQIFENHNQIRILRKQREDNAQFLRGLLDQSQLGQIAANDARLLQAQRDFADSLSQEYTALANYNNALASFQFAKGTLLSYNNVTIGEGPLPDCALRRAVDHQRERTAALVLRERANLPATTALDRPNLPALMENKVLTIQEPPMPAPMPQAQPNSNVPMQIPPGIQPKMPAGPQAHGTPLPGLPMTPSVGTGNSAGLPPVIHAVPITNPVGTNAANLRPPVGPPTTIRATPVSIPNRQAPPPAAFPSSGSISVPLPQ